MMAMMSTKASVGAVTTFLRPAARSLCTAKYPSTGGRCLPVTCNNKLANSMKSLQRKNFGTASALHQIAQTEIKREMVAPIAEHLTSVRVLEEAGNLLEVTCSTGRRLTYPILWLRVQCQCSSCYDQATDSRTLTMEEWSPTEKITSCSVTPCGGLSIEWNNGHKSKYDASWLLPRAFDGAAKLKHRNKYHLPRRLWTKSTKLPRYSYDALFLDDRLLLEFMYDVEVNGGVMLTGASTDMDSGYKLAEHIGICKKTNFGNMCNLYPKDGATNLAYTSRPLNLHTDLVFYDETPGVLFLHALEQHRGIGGDTILSDGFKAAEVMRREYPKQFHILSTANAYFTDRGVDSNSETQSGFPYIKLNRGRVINLDSNNDISYIRYSNHLLDSFTDIPVGEVDEFFQAYKLFYNLNMEHSLHFKINDGEMLVADNHRVLHGRETLQGKSSRHLVITYITWDEARCRRRRLQEKFPEILPNLP